MWTLFIEEPALLHFEGSGHYAVVLKISFYFLWELKCSLFPGTWPSPTHDLDLILRIILLSPNLPETIKWLLFKVSLFVCFLFHYCPHCLFCVTYVKLLMILLLKRGLRGRFGAALFNLTQEVVTGQLWGAPQ